MAMTACYSNYDLSGSQGVSQIQSHQTHNQSHHLSSIQQNRLTSSANSAVALTSTSQQAQKDYSIPLHVDCSVEYELPNQAKPPVGSRVEPLLMIHPCYFRKMESQRRSPFINNMPNPTRSSNSSLSNVSSAVATSSNSSSTVSSAAISSNSRRNNNAISNNNTNKSSNSQVLSSTVSHQSHQMQSQQHINHQQHNNYQNHHHHQNVQLDQYMQRQMAHISQQAQYPVAANVQQQQNGNQYLQNSQNQQIQQLSSNVTWDRYLNVGNGSSDMLSRVPSTKTNIPNQNAYKKNSKRTSNNILSAACANTFSNNILEGGLPSGGRWDIEKTSMAAIPRDYQAGPESIPQSHHQMNQQQSHKNHNLAAVSVYHNQGIVGKRDAMLSGGCSIYNSNSNPNTDISSITSGLWDQIEKSPMATIPSNYQAGPDSIPNSINSNSNCKKQTLIIDNSYETSSNNSSNTANKSLTNSNNNNKNKNNSNIRQSGSNSYHHQHLQQHHQQQQQQQQQQTTLLHQNESKLHSNGSNNLINGKYKQFLRSHRIHPYLMSGNILSSSSSGVLSTQNYSVASQFPHLNGTAFPQIQQVSCYNV